MANNNGGPLGPGTQVIDGQRFALPQGSAFFPTAFGPQTVGVPQVSPTMPAFLGGSASGGGMSDVNGYGTADNNTMVTSIASMHPFNWKVSPVLWAVIGLVVSILLIQKIHWRKTILEGEEHIGLGGAREEASVAA